MKLAQFYALCSSFLVILCEAEQHVEVSLIADNFFLICKLVLGSPQY